ncbi:MAG: hypothetical protein WC091_04730 [Sulfuricellaceae bacterium]
MVDVNTTGIEGWAADAAGISRIEIWAQGKMLGSTKLGIDRPDVAENFPQCNFPVASGYRYAWNIGGIPPSAIEMEIRAVNGGGKAFTVGRVPVDFSATPMPPPCNARGSIDAPQVVDVNTTGIEGWAADAAGISRIEIWAQGKMLGSIRPGIDRPDIAANFPQCNFPVASGYRYALDIGGIPPSATEMEIRAVNGGGKAFTVGRVPVDLARPFGALDVVDPIENGGHNLIGGWAIAAQNSVSVRVLAQNKEVLVLPASNRRDDVAKVFPAWPQAAASGFEGLLPMHKLPRGRYRLRILFDDSKGHRSEIAGPEVRNDLPFGKVLAQHDKMMPPDTIELRAWLADEDGIRSARAETETGVLLGKMVRAQKNMPLAIFSDPRFNRDMAGDAPLKKGDSYYLHVPFASIPPGLQRLQVRVKDKAGNVVVLPGPLMLDKNQAARRACTGEKLRVFYPGGAVNFRDDFRQLQELRSMAQGGCVEIGLRGRVEYMRTTKGKEADYLFDPDFPENLRKRNDKEMTGESLRELLDTALRFRAPVMITLDGGVWADAKFAAPDLDIVDMLEQDERTVQWNQLGKSEPDDALKNLAGATESPELARMMSLNHYNRRFLDYKKRNLQAAVREIVAFNRTHPEIFTMVNFDPDQYINPWFYLTQWYDYNPDTLRQYREWLFHLGPYAEGSELAFSRREPALTLDEANRIAKQSWKESGVVEPPRDAIDYTDPWQQLWTQFKRHLVARHYDDLATWAVEAGLPEERIYTSQTFIQADVAVNITDTANGWNDQAGVSIEGAKPKHGHLGAILYGPGSRNEGKPRSGSGLIDNIRRTDSSWGMVEFHPGTIAFPEKMPSHAESYATMQALINGGARFLSPMWGSYAGDRVVHPNHFKAYDVMEGSAFEYQLVWWLRAMQAWPLGSLYYPFGNTLVQSTDGWTAMAGTRLESGYGKLRLTGAGSHLGLASPQWEARSLAAPLELAVTGSWPQQTAASADLTLNNGEKMSCTLKAASKSEARCVFLAAPELQISRLNLQWRLPAAQQNAGVAVDSVALKFSGQRTSTGQSSTARN